MKLIYPKERPLTLAVVGMARAGSTIMASFLNSLDGAFVVGEPHSMLFAERPYGADWPVHILSQYGDFVMYNYGEEDVLAQIRQYARANNADIYGFKDVWTQNTNPLDIVSMYGRQIDYVFVLIREPRAIYQSTLEKYRVGQIPTSPITLYQMLDATFNFCSSDRHHNIIPLSYELFIQDPKRHFKDAAGWEIEGEVELVQFPGAGDGKGRTSRTIDPINKRTGYQGPMLNGSDKLYADFLEKFPHLRS